MADQLTFYMKNPEHVGVGYSIVPIPQNHTSSVGFSRGPEPDTAYVLWKKNTVKEKNDDGEINPTIASHKGWTMIAKCIFRGWKGHSYDEWEPNMSTLIKTNSSISDADLNEAIKFRRHYRHRYGRKQETNQMVNNFYWEKIIKPSEHSDLFYNEGVKNQTVLNVLSKKNNTLKQNMGKDTSTLMMGYLGGRKRRRKTRRKRRRKTRRKRRRKTQRKKRRKTQKKKRRKY